MSRVFNNTFLSLVVFKFGHAADWRCWALICRAMSIHSRNKLLWIEEVRRVAAVHGLIAAPTAAEFAAHYDRWYQASAMVFTQFNTSFEAWNKMVLRVAPLREGAVSCIKCKDACVLVVVEAVQCGVCKARYPSRACCGENFGRWSNIVRKRGCEFVEEESHAKA